ncbi:hypothetical protein [Caulobacter sp.]|uniref:hypothetical protein n=1 Tax=Caulobacter sp. TaxID=78 RepID=UPI003BAE712F
MRGLSKLSGFVGWIALAVDLAFTPSSDLALRATFSRKGRRVHDTMDRHATVELTMPPAPLDELPDDVAEALADADIEAGRVVSHALVREWLRTLGTPEQIPLRSFLLDGATSAPTKPVEAKYFEALRKRIRDR